MTSAKVYTRKGRSNIYKEDLYKEIEDTKLRYLLTISAESEQMTGWDDSLSLLLAEIDKSIFA